MDTDFDSLFQDAGTQYGVDPALLKLQAQAESSLNPKAIGPQTKYGRAKGLVQLTDYTARSLGVTDPYDPKQAIPAQARLMAENLQRYGNTNDALAAYHGGTDKSQWGPKTQAYVQKISDAYQGAKPKMPDLPSDDLDSLSATGSDPAAEATLPSDELDAYIKGSHENEKMPSYIDDKGIIRSKSAASPELANDFGTFTSGVGSGIIDVPRSLAAPLTYAYDKLPGNKSDASGVLAQETASRNNALTQQYGGSPVFGAGRLTGNVAATMPLMAAGGEIAGAPLNMLTRASPEIAQSLSSMPTLARYVAGIGRGTAEGYEAGGLTSANSDSSPSDASGTGAEVGAALSTFGPLANAGGRAVANTFMGGSVDPDIAKLAQTASDKYGIKIPGAQLSDNPVMNRTYSLLNRFGLTGKNDGAAQVTTALADEMGGKDIAQASGNKLSNDALDKIGARIGGKLDDAADQINKLGGIQAGKPFIDKLDDLALRAKDSSAPIDGVVGRIKGAIQNDQLTGEQYQKLIAKGEPLWNLMHSPDPTTRSMAGEAKDMLDDALEKSTNDPKLKKQIQDARYQYKVYANFAPLAEKNNGIVPPTSIFNVAKTKFGGNIKSARNAGNIGELGQIGQQFALDPSSGTAENLLLSRAGQAVGLAGLGGEGTLIAYNPLLAAKSAAVLGGVAGAGRGLGAYLSSDMLRNSIIKRSMQQGTLPAQSTLANALNPALLTGTTVGANKLAGAASGQ